MRIRFTLLIAASLLSLPLFAAEQVSFATRDGHTFENVTVQRVNGRRLEILTAAGPKSLRYTNLPREIQERFFAPSMLYPPSVGDMLDFKTADGVAYKGALREISPTGISIETSHGIDTIAFAKLPKELANTFDYDPEDAARYEAALRAQKARALAAQQAAERKAEAERVARERAERNAQRDEPPAPGNATMGDRGARNLGTPQLGGKGLGK